MTSKSIMKALKLPRHLTFFTLSYCLLAVGGTLATGNREFLIYLAVMAVLIAAVLTVHRRCHLSSPLLWCFSLWGLLHMAGGLVALPPSWPIEGDHAVLYSLWLIPDLIKYDQVIHAYGFGITTWLCWEALRNGACLRWGWNLEPTVGLMVLCAAAGMGFGALNEIVEFCAVLALPDTNVGGYYNTGWDLVYNALGAFVVALVIYRRKSSASPIVASQSLDGA